MTTHMKTVGRTVACLFVLLQAELANSATPAIDCVTATPALEGMQERNVRLTTEGQTLTVRVRIADEGREKAAGFQHICPAAFKDTRILFVYDTETRIMFHMRNVLDGLDIAFFDKDGELFEVQQMKPYPTGAKSGPRTRPSRAFRYALEAPTGYFAENKLHAGKTTLQWRD